MALVVILSKVRENRNKAYIQSVSDLNMSWVLTENSSDGEIVDDDAQAVSIDDDKKIAEVYVKKGDKVKKGDPLLRYDDTSESLEVESAQLDLESTQNDLVAKQNLLAKYQSIVPIAGTQDTMSALTDDQKLPTAYKGKGTEKNPYCYLCTDSTILTGNQINNWVANKTVVSLEIHTDNKSSGALEYQWLITGSNFIAVDDDSYWSVTTKEQWYPPVPTDNGDTEESYTQEQKDAMIADVTQEINDLNTQIQKNQLDIKTAKQSQDDLTVKSLVDGVVKEVGDINNPNSSGSAFLTITADQGMAISGYVNEFDYPNTKPGDKVTVTSWSTSSSSTATITSVSDYPDENYTGSSGNTNSSYYKYKAYLENDEGFSLGDSVGITPYIDENSTVICLEKVYVRSDGGKSYVYIDDGTGHLKKQIVKTSPSTDSQYILVNSGLKLEDMIAFPYGTSAQDGYKTTTTQSFSLF